MDRRIFMAGLAAPAAAWSLTASAQQDYPNKPVRVVVPFAVGGPNDVVARLLCDRLGRIWGQSFIVDNREGAGSIVGTREVIRTAPDGYNLLWQSNSLMISHALDPKAAGFDPLTSVVPIFHATDIPFILLVNAQSPIKTPKDLVAFMKAHPGKANQGSSGTGTTDHLLGQFLIRATGVSFTHVPYKGNAKALTDLASGSLDFVFSAAIQTALPLIQAGKLRAIAVTGKTRTSSMPDLPTLSEALGVEIVGVSWSGAFAPAGTPDAIVQKLNTGFNEALAVPEVKQALARQSAEGVGGSVADFKAFAVAENTRWTDAVKSLGPIQ